MNDEVWREIKEYEGLYWISNKGKVKNKKNVILKLRKDKSGYLIAYLYKKRKMKCKKVHRLVAQAFIENVENKPQVNHINGLKIDNNVENLEWVTASENVIHAFNTGLHKVKHGSEHNNARKIIQYSLDNQFIKQWGSIVEAAKYYNTTIENIYSCLNKKSKTARGFKWEYL